MSQTTPPLIDALPTAPSTSAPTTFAALADAFVAALATFRTQINTLADNVYANALDAYSSALASLNSASNSAASAVQSAASATAAAGAGNAAAWNVGTAYTLGQCVYSPSNFQTYRCKSGITGGSDPSLNSTNWAILGSPPVGAVMYLAQFNF